MGWPVGMLSGFSLGATIDAGAFGAAAQPCRLEGRPFRLANSPFSALGGLVASRPCRRSPVRCGLRAAHASADDSQGRRVRRCRFSHRPKGWRAARSSRPGRSGREAQDSSRGRAMRRPVLVPPRPVRSPNSGRTPKRTAPIPSPAPEDQDHPRGPVRRPSRKRRRSGDRRGDGVASAGSVGDPGDLGRARYLPLMPVSKPRHGLYWASRRSSVSLSQRDGASGQSAELIYIGA